MKLYSRIDTKDTYFEIWGGSTKHPDVRRKLSNDVEMGKFIESNLLEGDTTYKFFQWIIQCISELDFGTYDKLKYFMRICEPYFEEKKSWLY